MDTTVSKLITEALKQSPESGNGYGFALAAVVTLAALVLAAIGILYIRFERYRAKQDTAAEARYNALEASRSESRERLENKLQAAFDRLEQRTDSGFDKLEDSARASEARINELDKRLVLLEALTKSLKQ